MIDQKALRARIRRLEELSLGLGIDEELFRKCSAPLECEERDAYREALRQAINGVEAGRIGLVRACARLEGLPRRITEETIARVQAAARPRGTEEAEDSRWPCMGD